MKNLIFTIATVLVAFTNSNAHANQNESSDTAAITVSDSVAAPVSLDVTTEQSMQQVISEDIKIVETTIEPVSPLQPGKSFEGIVTEDAQVIENTLTKDVYPLDFKKINQKNQDALKIKNNKQRLIGCL
jgi:hypothetical protein